MNSPKQKPWMGLTKVITWFVSNEKFNRLINATFKKRNISLSNVVLNQNNNLFYSLKKGQLPNYFIRHSQIL